MNLKQILRWLRRERQVEHFHYPDGSEEVYTMRARPWGWSEDRSITHKHYVKTGETDENGVPLSKEVEPPNRPGGLEMSDWEVKRLSEKTNRGEAK